VAWFTYVLPCTWEDHCKVGFSRDPLARIGQLHPRWFEFFDLARGLLVEGETQRDARDIELALRRPLAAHRAPQPLAVRNAAGGWTEWLRGADAGLREAVDALSARGHVVHAPLSAWLRDTLHARRDLLYDWTERLRVEELEHRGIATTAQRTVRDTLDAHAALGVAFEDALPPGVLAWYRHVALVRTPR
jgi:hypothetical protein